MGIRIDIFKFLLHTHVTWLRRSSPQNLNVFYPNDISSLDTAGLHMIFMTWIKGKQGFFVWASKCNA